MATQLQVIEKLEPQAIRAVDQARDKARRELADAWDIEKADLRRIIMDVYQRDFPRGNWSITTAKASLNRIAHAASVSLFAFLQRYGNAAARAYRDLYRQSALRSAWILDQVTPETVQVHLPKTSIFRESSAAEYRGPNADTAWRARIAQWVDAYHSALMQNLSLGAINDSSMNDAVDEVDATRAGTPTYDMAAVLERIFITQAQTVITGGQQDVADANRSIGVKEIWQTRYNPRVCDICDEQLGRTMDEATADIPAHPNCECYWRLVPASFADLLDSPDFGDRELARRIDAANLTPSGMYVRDGDGVSSMAVMTFQKWLEDNALVVSGR